jgi:uncharacterized protein YegL
MTFDADFSQASDLYASLDDVVPNSASYRRRIVIVLLDLSTSMSFLTGPADNRRPRIDLLNEQLRQWLPQVRRQGADSLRDVEFAVIAFSGHGVRFLTGGEPRPGPHGHEDGGAFVAAADLDVGKLAAHGTTPLVEAVSLALDLGAARVGYLARERQLQTGQVRIVMFTDGSPPFDRDLPADAWQAAAERVSTARSQRHIQFFTFGAPGADEAVLRAMSGDRGYFPLTGFDFAKLLDLILVASSADDPVAAIWDELGWEVPGT